MADLEFLMYRLKNNANFVEDVTVTQELQEHLDRFLDPSFSTTEKVIYYYIMLAKTLSYDPAFFAHQQRGEIARLHETPFRTCEITPSNYHCVCYEASALFEKILHNLGVEYEVVKHYENIYGREHSSTKIVVDHFILTADIMKSSVINDAFYSKIGKLLNNIRCINQESDSRAEFKELFQKVYNYVNEKTLSVDDIKAKNILNSVDKTLSFSEKIENLISDFEFSEHLPFMERLAYLKHLYFSYFTNYQLSANIHMVIAREHIGEDEYMPIALFAVNNKKVSAFPEKNLYFGFDSSFEFHQYTYQELQELFDNYKYEYLDYVSSNHYAGSYSYLEGINQKRKLPW